MGTKILFSLLLVLSILAAFLAPTASSQSYTTLTSYSTATLTNFYQETIYQTSTTTFTAYGGGFDVQSSSIFSTLCSEHVANIYNARAGDKMTGAFTATSPVTFYVLTTEQTVIHLADELRHHQNSFVYPDPCASTPDHLLEADSVASYSLDFTVPFDGDYVLLFVNHGPTTDATVSLMVYLEHEQSQSNTIFQTRTQPVIQTVLQTAEVPFYQTYSNWLTPLAIIAILAVGFVAFRIASKRMKPT